MVGFEIFDGNSTRCRKKDRVIRGRRGILGEINDHSSNDGKAQKLMEGEGKGRRMGIIKNREKCGGKATP